MVSVVHPGTEQVVDWHGYNGVIELVRCSSSLLKGLPRPFPSLSFQILSSNATLNLVTHML